ncbi:MerR family transcriptional regulator [Solibacillus isronensis]|uniref:MerR family transcriptional regulator n=1 Tax=Solibacillus isronensis TaxID=412383 RepID=UPI00203ABC98|nr:MerR family transcriptional regulator [Solibacillus isronensis]
MLINELVKLSGVSARTLRYYDEIGLLRPSAVAENGYRQYSQGDIDRLQQILFYRELDFKLEEIKKLLDHPDYEVKEALKKQFELLQKKRRYIDDLLITIEQTIQTMEGELKMTNEQKFDVFKNKLIEENEKSYGQEVREKYGEAQVEASNKKFRDMTEEQYNAMQQLENQLFERLKEAMASGDVTSDVAMEAAELHKRWLSFSWAKYTSEAHIGLAQMYVSDERFTAYYDERVGPGATKFLHDVIAVYAANK